MSTSMTAPSPAAPTTPPRVLSAALSEHVGARIRIAGWLHRRRLLKSVAFAIVRDRSGLAQVVVSEEVARARLEELNEETVVEVTGTVVANPAAPGGVELVEPVITVLGEAEAPPFDLYRPSLRATLPTLLDRAPVSLRHPRRKAAFELASAATMGFRETVAAMDFTEIFTPKIVASATESGANVFAIDYFGRPGYLAQSPQFYKQTMVGVFERVFEVGPVFRAEPHDTVRHLAEYTSLDVEFGFIESYRDVAEVLREVVAGMVSAVAERAAAAVALLEPVVPQVPSRFPELHFAEALELISRETGEDLSGVNDLSPAHERWVGEWARREHGSDFAVVVGYPMSKRPFYTAEDPGRPGYSDSFDLLFRGTEMVTGGRRLHRYADYLAAIAAQGGSPEPYAGYLEAFKHGMPPHGGFAIGLERFVAQLTGVANIREVTLFPRDLHRIAP
ncbi:aspartate--tRNA(Asn) ligase [Stackebrandtia nassauensis]|uniref:Aspartate--tRNA(Asp/Asn) ligase n=1 Tax=Stackebrandtia nassauensis (strain DSM 44728 / CIP 108903 / NRRL B-16338 / NBRC 102104 / LLR-40K-21) TaxID=446470 RepID=D3Q8T8_STANL|nr:aspartate--tRNA(Asn) ligase [Stackebrandtia nassauensis]ADD44530.1 Aspartate--tRNA ligase [Stackebrandtia nassauensis DSM 44728]